MVSAGGTDSGAGAAVVRIHLRSATTDSDAEPCSTVDFSSVTPVERVLTTASALATITEAVQGGVAAVSLSGVPLNCADWNEDAGASLVMPNANANVAVPVLGTYDIAQALRLNDD